MDSSGENSLLKEGELLKGRWKVLRKIGGGGFGEIYEAVDKLRREKVAVKVESRDVSKPVLRMEVTVLKKLQGSPFACVFHGCGRNELFNYIVMQLQGRNLSELRRGQAGQRFSLATALLLTYEALSAVEAVHNQGFLHRDVKPSNFAIGRSEDDSRKVYILDYGLARQYVDQSGRLRPARNLVGFRGTVRYASLNAHKHRELGRHDDLISLFYMVVEFITGNLPWRKIKDKDQVAQMKRSYTASTLLGGRFDELQNFFNYLRELTYHDCPNYEKLRRLLSRTMKSNGVCCDQPFDWEEVVLSSSELFDRSPRPPASTVKAYCTGKSYRAGSPNDTEMAEMADEWSDNRVQ